MTNNLPIKKITDQQKLNAICKYFVNNKVETIYEGIKNDYIEIYKTNPTLKLYNFIYDQLVQILYILDQSDSNERENKLVLLDRIHNKYIKTVSPDLLDWQIYLIENGFLCPDGKRAAKHINKVAKAYVSFTRLIITADFIQKNIKKRNGKDYSFSACKHAAGFANQT